MSPDPPTPDVRDIHLQALASGAAAPAAAGAHPGRVHDIPEHEPPAYSPLDAYTYSEGVQLDLPAEVIAAALERGALPPTVIGPSLSTRSDRHRSRRERRS